MSEGDIYGVGDRGSRDLPQRSSQVLGHRHGPDDKGMAGRA